MVRKVLVLGNNQCHLRLLAHDMMLLGINRRTALVIVNVELMPSVKLAIGGIEQSATRGHRVTFVKHAAST